MNAKQWMRVFATAVIIPGALAACAHEKAPVVPSSEGTAYWESELPRDELSLRAKSEKENVEAPAPDENTANARLPGRSDTFLWDKSTNSTTTPSAQEPLRSHKPRMDERTNTPREPLF